MVAEAPDDLVVVGDGALMAALTRSRGARMRDIVATIQRHQDEAIRAPAPAASPRSPAAPAPARPSSPCTARPTCSTPTGAASSPAASSSSAPPRAYTAYIERVLPSPRRGDRHAALPRRRRRRRHRRAARPPRGRGDQGLACGSARCWRAPPADAVPGRARPSSAPSSPARPSGSTRRASTGCAPRCCATHQRNLAADGRRAAPWPRRPGPASGTGDRGRVPRPVRGPPRGRRLPRGVVAPGRPARGAAVARRPRARHAATAAGILADDEGDAARRVDAPRPRDRHLVGRRRRARRRPRRAARPGPGRPARGARLLRDRGARRRLAVRRRRGAAGRRRAAAADAGAPRRPDRPARAAAAGRHRRPRRVRPRPRRRGPGPLADAVADARPPRPRTRRGPSSATPRRPRGPTPPRPAARARRRSATQERRLFHMDTNYRNAREIFDYARRGRSARSVPDADIPQAVRETGVEPVDARRRPATLAVGGDRRGRDAARRGRGLDRGHHPVDACRSGSPGWPSSATAASRSSTRCRPRAWSTTPPSSSTPTRSPRSHPAASACSTSR